jgi:hypothetical protein
MLVLAGQWLNHTDFKSKKIRVNLAQPIKAEQKAEQSEVLQSVDEDRKFVYQATIVRIMKARKVGPEAVGIVVDADVSDHEAHCIDSRCDLANLDQVYAQSARDQKGHRLLVGQGVLGTKRD